MAVEAPTTISGLNVSWPLGSDVKSEGDDHFRMLKTLLQTQFGGGTGADIYIGAKTGPDRFVVNDKADATGTEVFSVTDTGTVTAKAAFLSGVGSFGSTTATAILGTNSAGNVYLRPNGWSVTTGQTTVTTSGALTVATSINTDNGAGLFIGKSGADFYLQFLTNYNFNVNAGTGRLTLILNASNRSYWEIDGKFVHLGAAYKPGGGSWIDSSDARIKNVVGDYQLGLDEVRQLRPVIYTYKGNDTPEDPEADKATVPPFKGSPHNAAAQAGTEFVGLIAQEAETALPGMVTKKAGWIDGLEVDDLRDLDTTELIFALVNAVKQLAARLETLEAGAPFSGGKG